MRDPSVCSSLGALFLLLLFFCYILINPFVNYGWML
uniref:Uncharacterized protein n=1 Tax=Aegilops tauschii subsp. strangulata TaxID=200361 RepID=A0A453S6H1_AEGTS